jgi:hypothetical protein
VVHGVPPSELFYSQTMTPRECSLTFAPAPLAQLRTLRTSEVGALSFLLYCVHLHNLVSKGIL